MQTLNLKHCPACLNDLAVDEFGLCRARKDGRNLYCKSCIRVKVFEFRQRKKEMKRARKGYQKAVAMERTVPPNTRPATRTSTDKVRAAIQEGVTTREAIQAVTKLRWDELSEALAALTFDLREVRIERAGNKREFHLVA